MSSLHLRNASRPLLPAPSGSSPVRAAGARFRASLRSSGRLRAGLRTLPSADYNAMMIEFLLLPILILLFSTILYLPVLHSPFLFDDIAVLDSMPPEYLR